MTDWAENAEQDAGEEMTSQPAGAAESTCEEEGWEAVIDAEPLPRWEATLDAEPMELWQPEESSEEETEGSPPPETD